MIHEVTGYIAATAGVCAVAASETVVVGAICGAIAVGAGGANEATSIVLFAEDKESGLTFALDTASLATFGAGYATEVGAEGAAGLADQAGQVAELWKAATREAGLFSKAGPFVKEVWYSAKASAWAKVAEALGVVSKGLGIASSGLGVAGNVTDGHGGSNNCGNSQ